MAMTLQTTIPLELGDLLPKAEYFDSCSDIHGRMHVGRVMILGFLLLDMTSARDLEIPLWAAIYLHDLGRQHDGDCREHGQRSRNKFHASREIQRALEGGGLVPADWPMVEAAVIQHCHWRELDAGDPHYRLTALLKDADGLDRVRLGDLDPAFFRCRETRSLTAIAAKLFRLTAGRYAPDDPALMDRMWQAALSALSE
jgi:hypothetical protein